MCPTLIYITLHPRPSLPASNIVSTYTPAASLSLDFGIPPFSLLIYYKNIKLLIIKKKIYFLI
jgi:hypothetical protein